MQLLTTIIILMMIDDTDHECFAYDFLLLSSLKIIVLYYLPPTNSIT